MALSFDIGANERAAVRSVKNLGAALEKTSDSLDDVARDGDQALGKLEKSFEQLAREAKQTDKAVGKVGDGGFKKAGDASGEFKNEALQNFSEVTSSFDGSMSSIGDLAQGTLGGIASSIPGIGLLGGAAAVGVGLVTAELVRQEEAAQVLRERLSAAYLEAAQAGRDYIDTAQAIAETQDLITNPDRREEYNQLVADGNRLGLDFQVIADANAGKVDAQRQVQERINGLLEDQDSYYTTIRDGIQEMKPEIEGITERWGQVIGATKEQQEQVRVLEEYTAQANANEREQIKRTADASQARYDALARQASKGVTIPVRIDDREAYNALARFQNRAAQGVRVPVGLGRTLE